MIKLEMAKLETAKLQKKCDKVVGCVMLVLTGSCCDEAGDGEAADDEAADDEAADEEAGDDEAGDACARLLLR